MKKSMGPHTSESFKEAFDVQYVPEAFREVKRVEFEKLVQGSMIVVKYKKNF